MRIGLLGGVTVTGGTPAETVEGARLGGRRAHLLVTALALEPGPLGAERLASLIWDDPPSTWRVAVRGLVGELRKRLADIGRDIVVTTTTGTGEEKRTFSMDGGDLVVETSVPARIGAPNVTKVTYKRYERGHGG